MSSHFDSLPCLYFSCTDEGKLIDINNAASNALGYLQEELEGKKIDLIFTVATRIFQQTHFFPLLKLQGHAEEIFISLQTKNKEEIPVLLNAVRYVTEGEGVCVYTGIPVYNRKKFEDELIAAKKTAETALQQNTALTKAKQELQQNMDQLNLSIHLINQQNEELRQFNRVVTHDLQEPLRKLSLYANLLLPGTVKKDPVEIAEKIVTTAVRMRALLSGLQEYVWLTETPALMKDVDLNTVLFDVKQQLEKSFSSPTFVIHAENLPVIQADENQMKLLLYHLLSNAIRFKKPGSAAHVKISADIVPRNKYQNITGKYAYTDFLKLEIKDEGLGFSAEYTAQAFELFKRLHAESGLGIGLPLCKKIADNHKGQIMLETKEGAGTGVTVFLPVMQG